MMLIIMLPLNKVNNVLIRLNIVAQIFTISGHMTPWWIMAPEITTTDHMGSA